MVARARRAQGRHQIVEGHIGVGEGLQGRLAHLLERRREVARSLEVGAQDHGVDEEPDESLRAREVSVGDRHADDQVQATGEAVQEDFEDRQQGHEKGRVPVPCEVGETAAEGPGERQVGAPAPARQGLGPGTIGGQLQGPWGRGQPATPISETVGAPIAGAVGEGLGVLQRQRWKLRGFVVHEGSVQRFELADQQDDRSRVRHDVMNRQDDAVLGSRKTKPGRTKERSGFQVERLGALFGDPPPHVVGVPSSAVEASKAYRTGRVNDLPGTVGAFDEGRPQRLVAAADRLEAALEDAPTQLAVEADDRGDVVGGIPRIQAVQDPEPLLSGGRRSPVDRRCRRRAAGRCGGRRQQPEQIGFVSGEAVAQLRGEDPLGGSDLQSTAVGPQHHAALGELLQQRRRRIVDSFHDRSLGPASGRRLPP